MRYVGGKSRVAPKIAHLIRAGNPDATAYVEPFLGGGAAFSTFAPMFKTAVAADVVPDLVLLFQEVLDGWTPPDVVTEDDYRAFRHASPSALRGFIGYGCSFGAKWWGGYARDRTGKTNFAAQQGRTLARQKAALDGVNVEIRLGDYRSLKDTACAPGTVVYCDPPYAGTTGYAGAGAFDSAAFWSEMTGWVAAGATVFVSEYAAPDGWVVVWEGSHRQSLQGGTDRPVTTERLYADPLTAARLAQT
jgi:DNA adenine methylase